MIYPVVRVTTSAKEVMFLSWSVCLSVRLFVSRVLQKVVSTFREISGRSRPLWKSLGKLFHRRGPATLNSRLPNVVLQCGTVQRQCPDDHNVTMLADFCILCRVVT